MQADLVSALRRQCPQIRARWKEILRAEPVSTPLANPDALVHLLDWSVEEIFRSLSMLASRRRTGHPEPPSDGPVCPCGRNPLLAYFAAGEQAVREALVLAQAAAAPLDPRERDAALLELDEVLHMIAHREIEAFCGVCQHRTAGTASASA